MAVGAFSGTAGKLKRTNPFNWMVTVPANTTATVYVPAKDVSHVMESGQAVESANGVTVLRIDNGRAVFSVAAGTYHFSSRLE